MGKCCPPTKFYFTVALPPDYTVTFKGLTLWYDGAKRYGSPYNPYNNPNITLITHPPPRMKCPFGAWLRHQRTRQTSLFLALLADCVKHDHHVYSRHSKGSWYRPIRAPGRRRPSGNIWLRTTSSPDEYRTRSP